MLVGLPSVGEDVGGYRLDARLGEGGMGVVFEATHNVLGKKAAIKLMRPKLCADEESVKRFFNEAVLTASIRHPGIVDVFDYGVHPSGAAFIAMELLEGRSLEQRLKQDGALAPRDALRVARQIAGALGAAHGAGVVHRDLKPDNVFLCVDEEVPGGERIQLLDFGIAKLLDDDGSTTLTRTGTVLGTPLYMSPEQCRGRSELDGRTDLYALGCMLYEMLAGRPPFLGESAFDVASAHVRDEPTPLATYCPGLSSDVAALVEELLAKDPADRPESATDVHERIGGLLELADTQPMSARADKSTAPSLELAETIVDTAPGTGAAAAETMAAAPPRRLWRWAILAVPLAVAAVVIALGVRGGDHRLATPLAIPTECDPDRLDECRRLADHVLRGDGYPANRARALELLDDGCAKGHPATCIDLVRAKRLHMMSPHGEPFAGNELADVYITIVVDFGQPDISALYDRFLALTRARVGRIAVYFVGLAHTERLWRLAVVGCLMQQSGALSRFNDVRADLLERLEQTKTLNALATSALLPVHSGDNAERVENLKSCKEWVGQRAPLLHDLRLRHGDLLIGRRRLRAPYSDVAIDELVELTHRMRMTREGRNALKAGVPSARREMLPTVGLREDVPVHVTTYCDPIHAGCAGKFTMTWATKAFDPGVSVVLRPVSVTTDGRGARGYCAAERQGLGFELLRRMSIARRRKLNPTADDIAALVAEIGGDVSRYKADLVACAEEVEANNRAIVELTDKPDHGLTFVNGRPLRIHESNALMELLREELELAERLGFGTVVKTSDWHARLHELTSRSSL